MEKEIYIYVSHYGDIIMSTMASQITSLTIVYSTVHSGADQRKHQSSASLAFVRRIHRSPVNSPHKRDSNAENISIWWRHHAKINSAGQGLRIYKCTDIYSSLLDMIRKKVRHYLIGLDLQVSHYKATINKIYVLPSV